MANAGIYNPQPIISPERYTMDRQEVESGRLNNLLGGAKLAEYRQGVERQGALRNLLSSGADSDAIRRGGFLKEAGEWDESAAKARKDDASALSQRTTMFGEKTRQFKEGIGSLASPQAAARYLRAAFDDKDLGPVMQQFGTLDDAIREVPNDPAGFQNWQAMLSEGIGKVRDHTLKAATQAQTASDHKAKNVIAARQASTAEGQLRVSRERLNFDKTKPQAANSRSGPMSVTLQKELIESDDNVQQSASAIAALKKAKTINDKAYSGYGASGRAKLMSNVYETDEANATIELDNLIGQQALSSMKSIFGGNPTEGERAILLDLQASSSKTPAQRTAILDRAIKAAEVRAKFATSKAQSIRNGKYLTEGAPIPDADNSLSDPDKQALDWANANANDPRAKQIKQRLGM